MAKGKDHQGKKKGFNPFYAVRDSATGLYLDLGHADEPRLACLANASLYSTHLDVCTAISAVRAPLPVYDVVRVDA